VGRACSTYGRDEKFWSGCVKRRRLLGSRRRRWEDNIRMDLTEIQMEGVNWIHLAQHRDLWRSLMNTAVRLRFP
jgi:hypothetical protein